MRRTRPRPGRMFSRSCHGLTATASLLSLKRAYSDARRMVQRHGRWPDCYRLSSLSLSQGIATASKDSIFISTSLTHGYASSNVDPPFEAHHYLIHPSRSIYTDGIRVGALAMHKDALYGTLDPTTRE